MLPHSGSGAWLLVQFGSDDRSDSERAAGTFCEWLVQEKGHAPDDVEMALSTEAGGDSERIWALREAGLGATAFPPTVRTTGPAGRTPPSRPTAWRVRRRPAVAAGEFGLNGQFYGHFGQGCIHGRYSFELRDADGIAAYRAFLERAADLVVSYGGTLSGEHGDGQQRAELLSKQYGDEIVEAMREFKRIWDPDWKMNPGKVVDPYRLDENLKLGTDYNPHRPPTKFAYRRDGGDIAHATLRCVGVGKCRVPDSNLTMCPSYMATREEQHSTRGRARLLFEMLRGEIITDGWQSDEVYDALDLCLACKGCTNDCPVNVDIPTLKAEFLYHRFKSLRRWRPRYAYSFGFIDQASRLAARMPALVNLATQTPGLSQLAKLVGGIDGNRPLPQFAPTTLQQWFRHRGGPAHPDGRPVVLFPDTFNNHLHTQVGVACVEALEAAGCHVHHPRRSPLLRSTPLRLRVPRPGRVLPAHRARPAAALRARGHPGRRHGAELPRRVQGRAARAAPARRRRPATGRRRVPLRRGLRGAGPRRAGAGPVGAAVGSLPSPRHRWDRTRAEGARADGRAGP